MGRQILASHHFPTADIYSFTIHGQPWTAHEWLPECLMGLVYGRLRPRRPALPHGRGPGRFLYLDLLPLTRSGLGLPLASLLLALVLAASAHHFHVRPHILSIIFLGLTFAWLVDFEAGRRSLRSLSGSGPC